MKYLAVDYGTKRVGIALSDAEGLLAYPHSVLAAGKGLVQEVAELAKKEGIGTIVIGESRDLAGKPNPIMTKISAFSQELKKESTIPIVFENEVLSSQEADHAQGKDHLRDARAAAIILQSYLDRVRGYDFG